ncbi:uncharacterized protein P884DRAFT_278907 [Thermothelomyces heterothallicus CBS 202.75]|uniref:uncharacterized protein n=1 Tax=Thermothelomyces heterothallicus CBS 202.75 TaxID=1149848 RepID=UPI0037425C42
MGSLGHSVPPFPVLEDTRPDDRSLPAFMVSTTRGFLPRMDPIETLPPDFDALESILQRMPVKTLSGEPGLLAQGKLGETVDRELPDLTDAIDKYKDDLPLMNALYRDYSFLASAYLLEPCHERFVRGEGYGLARDVLPANIARPIAKCAALCNFKPFMEYAGSYALFNYRLVDPSKGLASDNLRLIRAFEHGLDPSSSEAGFVLVHIEMVKHSGPLVAGAVACIDACSSPSSSSSAPSSSHRRSRAELNEGLRTVLAALRRVNATMETMWSRSRPADYTSFRTFIFGIASQSMFPRGVLYEGVELSDDDGDYYYKDGGEEQQQQQQDGRREGGRRVAFRGESGANDSMIPLVDNLLSIPMPDTPLTEILRDFRSYRPGEHRRFLEWVARAAEEGGLKAWALGLDGGEEAEGEVEDEKRETRALWIQVLNQVRDFRWRHWCFAREYIIKRTSHPTATGGSPIVTWLPNQLAAVMDEMVRLYEQVGGAGLGAEVEDIMELVGRQRETLRKEVRKFCEERGVKEFVPA